VIIKTIGFALTIGVLADAFLVRMMLVPAFMSIIGERIWWLPAWLDRILPNVDIEGEMLMARLEGTHASLPAAAQMSDRSALETKGQPHSAVLLVARKASRVSTTSRWSSSCGRPETATVPMQPIPAHEDRKRAPMRGVLRHVEPSVPVKGPSVDPELLADTKRRAAVAVDDRTTCGPASCHCRTDAPASAAWNSRCPFRRIEIATGASADRADARSVTPSAHAVSSSNRVEDEAGLLGLQLVEQLTSGHGHSRGVRHGAPTRSCRTRTPILSVRCSGLWELVGPVVARRVVLPASRTSTA
jgi:hypothetical protein